MNEKPKTIKQIKAFLVANSISQPTVCRALGGINKDYLNRVLNERISPSNRILNKLRVYVEHYKKE